MVRERQCSDDDNDTKEVSPRTHNDNDVLRKTQTTKVVVRERECSDDDNDTKEVSPHTHNDNDESMEKEAGEERKGDERTHGITVLLINMSNSTTIRVSPVNDMLTYKEGGSSYLMREEYHLTPKDGNTSYNIQSEVVLLTGTPLKFTQSLVIPKMNPKLVDPSSTIKVKPDSIVDGDGDFGTAMDGVENKVPTEAIESTILSRFTTEA
ncbi:hypothetical protein V8G54_033019 [Vigna mungo]|uniref:Uncharacterized protein n=1 Tax=Vigna mungo TaxID=3915 RepID=A0AAQ3MME1_VIGMU